MLTATSGYKWTQLVFGNMYSGVNAALVNIHLTHFVRVQYVEHFTTSVRRIYSLLKQCKLIEVS